MDRPEARAEWESIFGDELSFDKVYKGKKQITEEQILQLLKHSVTPRDLEKHIPAAQNSEFVIWRTKLDDRVRAAHLRMEGKVYYRTEAQKIKDDSFGCRCDLKSAPNNLLIMDAKHNIISLNSWIRYGGSSTFVLKC
jgi:hypothetical protein